MTRAFVVLRLSVKPVVSETVKRINAKFGGKITCPPYLNTIFYCLFLTIFIVYFFYDFVLIKVKMLKWHHMGENVSNDISSENKQQIRSQKIMHRLLLERVSAKPLQRIVKYHICDLCHLFFFFVNMGPLWE